MTCLLQFISLCPASERRGFPGKQSACCICTTLVQSKCAYSLTHAMVDHLQNLSFSLIHVYTAADTLRKEHPASCASQASCAEKVAFAVDLVTYFGP